MFDHQKLAWMNGVHLRTLDPGLYAGRLRAFLRDRGSPIADRPEIDAVVPLVQEKIATLGEFEEFAGFLFHPVVYDEDAWQKVAAVPEAAAILDACAAALEASDGFETADVEAALRGVSEQLGREAARRIPAAAGGDLRPHHLAGAVRVGRAARARGVAGASARRPRPPVDPRGRRSRPAGKPSS